MLAPIVLFVYTRLKQTKETIKALQANVLANESKLFIYSDGPKNYHDSKKIYEIRKYLKDISGFKSVTLIESTKNKGLASSIIEGVSDIVNKFGKVIVIEDDIYTSPFFLQYMNDALTIYENEDRIMSISGYMYPHKQKLPETFFFNVPLCWGWATWARAWKHFNNNSQKQIQQIDSKKSWQDFNKFGGKYLERQLRHNASGKLSTWFINWHASIFLLNGYCLFPHTTLVNNVGFDSSGIHGSFTNSYKSELILKPILVEKQDLKENRSAKKIIKKFYLLKENSYLRFIKKKIIRIWSIFIRKED